jgi:DNA-binding IclR family transcriptional regulator
MNSPSGADATAIPVPALVDDGTDQAPSGEISPTLLPLALLEAVLERSGSWGVTELAEHLGLPKARVHRHLANLRTAGYLTQNSSTRKYEPGWRLLVLGQRIDSGSRVLTVARPLMVDLRDEVSQTIVLSTLTDSGVTVTEVVPGGSPIDVILSPGTRFHYNSAAQGKVALAFATERQRAVWTRLISEKRTSETVLDHAILWEQVAAVRKRGWSSAPEETFRGVNAVAAPVFGAGGEVAYTLALVGSIHFLPDPPPPGQVDALVRTARRLSRELGHPGRD